MRARALTVYQFWRDAGCAVGALASGVVVDLFGFEAAILSVAVLTLLSGSIVASGMRPVRLAASG
jgi:predicted MFS family arabinose efflux permease